MAVTYDQALEAAHRKAAEADFGSPFRYELTRRVPELIRRHCPPRADVLDVGCGSGRYALFFIEAGVQGSYTGVDISDERWSDLPLPPEFTAERRELDAHELPRLGRQYDCAISLTAFEHFADDRRVARGLAEVLRPGGHAVIAVPSRWSYALYGPHGYRRYSPASVRALFAGTGLTLIDLQPVGGLGGFLFHFHWFFPAALLRGAGKAILVALSAGDKTRAREKWPRAFAWLDQLGQHHLRWTWGRWLHRTGLRLASILDPLLPLLPVGYVAVARRTSA
jgi:SAM-dependent methyltransferase